jgi:hypothetical protein
MAAKHNEIAKAEGLKNDFFDMGYSSKSQLG